MGYQVLARKYRPQRFADVAGQDHVTRTLLNALIQNRIAHGYIFSGHRGIGKTTIARILAHGAELPHARSAAPNAPTPEPCGICDSCIEIRQGNAVDVIEIDAATNRGIDEIRELRDAARYCPGARPLQDLHPRRSAPDHRSGLQRAAQDAGRAAVARHLHDGDHRAGEHSADHPVALPALQLSRGQVRRHSGAAEDDRRRRSRWKPKKPPWRCWPKPATARCAMRSPSWTRRSRRRPDREWPPGAVRRADSRVDGLGAQRGLRAAAGSRGRGPKRRADGAVERAAECRAQPARRWRGRWCATCAMR